MKTIGLLGGMSWESSLEYYRIGQFAFRPMLDVFRGFRGD